MSVLAVVTFALAAVAALPLAIALLTGHTKPGPGHVLYFLLVFLGFILPASLYVFAAFHIRRLRAWAVIAGIVTASVHAAAALVVFVGAFIAMRHIGLFMLLPASASAVLFAMALWTIHQLTRTLRYLHDMSDDDRAAFTPILRPSEH